MRRVVLLAALAAFAVPASSKPALKGWEGAKPPKAPCECRYAGGKAQLGETICRMRGGRMVTLRCDLVLNNTSWTEIAEGCDLALFTPARPFPEPL